MFKRKEGRRRLADLVGEDAPAAAPDLAPPTGLSEGEEAQDGAGQRSTESAEPGTAPIEPIRLSGVSLLTSTDKGPVRVPDLGLSFDAAGVTVAKGNGDVVRVLPWDDLTGLSVEPLPAGAPEQMVALKVSTEHRSHHFVVGTSDPAIFRARLSQMARFYRGRSEPAESESQASVPESAEPESAEPESAVSLSEPAESLRMSESAEPERAAPESTVSEPTAPQRVGPRVRVSSDAGAPIQGEIRRHRKKGRMRRWMFGIFLLVVVVCAGLYLAQREGYIHFLPKSIVSAPSTTSASLPNATSAVGSAGTLSAKPIPGLPVNVVTTEMSDQGLSCAASSNGSFSCTSPTGNSTVRITQASGMVSMVSASYQGPATAKAANSLFQSIATLPYTGYRPQAAMTWLNSHLSSSGRATFGAAQLSLVALPNASVLQLSVPPTS